VTKAAILSFAVALSAPACFAVGAIARNPRTNVGTVVVNKSTRDAAEHDAILSCGTECEIVITFQNSCAAYAADFREKSTIYGYGQAGDKYKAGEAALNQCQDRGGSCHITDSGCDGN
jgi:hypothetical protein